MLTEAQIAQYCYDGYLFPFSALSAAEIAACNEGLARYEHWLGKPVNQADRRWRSASYAILPWVDDLVRHPRILDVVEDLIGRDILVYTATWFIKEARSPTFAAWHQDATYFGLEPHEPWNAGREATYLLRGRAEPDAVNAELAAAGLGWCRLVEISALYWPGDTTP